MVRALPYDPDTRVNAGRVLAFFAAIAIHVAALLMLLIPMAMPPIEALPRQSETTITFHPRELIEPVLKPITDEPVRQQPTPPRPTTPTTISPPQPIVQPSPVDTAHWSVPVDATSSESSVDSTSIAPPSGPVSSSHLRYVKAPPPPYPRAELMQGTQGSVLLRVLVGIDGSPLEVTIEKSSGNRNLDRSAREQVLKRWKFEPALQDGVAVQAYGLVPIDFKLQ